MVEKSPDNANGHLCCQIYLQPSLRVMLQTDHCYSDEASKVAPPQVAHSGV